MPAPSTPSEPIWRSRSTVWRPSGSTPRRAAGAAAATSCLRAGPVSDTSTVDVPSMVMSRDGLSEDQVAIVLRRAAELDHQLGFPHEPGIDEATLEEAAVEAGLSPQALHRALAELRSGVLSPDPRRHRGVLGDPTLTICRAVPGPLAEVERQLFRFLDGQLFELRRHRGTSSTWVHRRGLEATARRAIDRAIQ